jgi:hypothetical protein
MKGVSIPAVFCKKSSCSRNVQIAVFITIILHSTMKLFRTYMTDVPPFLLVRSMFLL